MAAVVTILAVVVAVLTLLVVGLLRSHADILRRLHEIDGGLEAAIGVVDDISGVMANPQYAALGTILPIDDPELGRIRMQNVLFRMSATPGEVRHTGRRHGQDTDAVLTERLGYTPEQVAALRKDGVV